MLFSETGSLPDPGVHLFTNLASHQVSGILKSVSPRAGIIGARISTEDLDSGPHAFLIGVLLIESSP